MTYAKLLVNLNERQHNNYQEKPAESTGLHNDKTIIQRVNELAKCVRNKHYAKTRSKTLAHLNEV